MAFSLKLKIFSIALLGSLVCAAQGGRHAPAAQQVDDSNSMGRGSGANGGSLPGFSRGAIGQAGQGQGQGQGQGATGGSGSSVPESPNRKKADMPLEFAKKAEEGISKGTEKTTAALEKLQQNFSSSLASLKPPEDDTIMKNLGKDLAERSEEAAKAPPVAGDITEQIVKSYQELSTTYVDTMKQKAVALAPPPGQALQGPPPVVTVAQQLAAFAGGSNKRASGNSLVTADAASSPSALIPALQNGAGGGRSDRLGAVDYGGPVRGITGPTLNGANSAVAASIGTGNGGFAANNFDIPQRAASGPAIGGGRNLASVGGSSIFSTFPTVGMGSAPVADEADEGVDYYDRKRAKRSSRRALKGSRGALKKAPGEATAAGSTPKK